MKLNEIRQKYLDFFKTKNHQVISSASLIPVGDPSVLFTTAGMHPLVPFLMGEKHPSGVRLVDYQKCIRTVDIDEVGDSSHLTFFEMMGNWSLGDYWKNESIYWSWEFLTSTGWLNLDKDRLAVSVFAGDQDCGFDQESFDIWLSLGVKEERIAKLGKDDNWWPAGGKSVGPQGPDTEIFYWTAQEPAPAEFDPKNKNWVEIWNNVFMEFERTAKGNYLPLKQKNVDTGLGLERTTVALQGKSSVYELEVFASTLEFIKDKAGSYNDQSGRIIADHLKAATFIIAEGIVPGNLDQGYVVRKLIRRAIRHGKKIGLPQSFSLTEFIIKQTVKDYGDYYPELKEKEQFIIEEIKKEEESFEKTLERGLRQFQKYAESKTISSDEAFDLYATYGFPLEMTQELAKELNIKVDEQGFEEAFHKHQELSKTASAGKFKGGLVDHSEMSVKYHTATHLLHQALRDVLGDHVEQRGSNITDQRLRFDFSHPEKMTAEEIVKVEEIVNQQIQNNLPVSFAEMPVEEAKKAGAIGLFGHKYGEVVKVYSVGDYSKEICGGPHVEKTGTMGKFKIKKEEASSAGIRRIKAILE